MSRKAPVKRPAPRGATLVAATMECCPSTMQTCSRALKLLADDTRLAIVDLLLSGPQHVHQINDLLQIDPTLLSHHLRVLREAGLITAVREGKSIIYRLTSNVRPTGRKRTVDFGCCVLSFRPQPRQVRKVRT